MKVEAGYKVAARAATRSFSDVFHILIYIIDVFAATKFTETWSMLFWNIVYVCLWTHSTDIDNKVFSWQTNYNLISILRLSIE